MHFFLEALIKRKKGGSIDASVKLLDQCLSMHINSTREHAIGFEFYTKLNADFLMELAKEYLEHSNNKAISKGEQVPRHLTKAVKLLENVLRQYPVISEAQIILAKAKWLMNDMQSSLKTLHECVQNDPEKVEAHVLTAVINIDSGNLLAAKGALQQALSLDFKIRENPVFNVIKA